MVIKRCDICGKKFEAEYDAYFAYCSDECKKKGRRLFSTFIKVCKNCGREFETDDNRRVYCCNECKEQANIICSRERYKSVTPVIKVCEICGKEFEGHGNAKYCSDECKKEARRRHDRERYESAKFVTKICKKCGKLFKATHRTIYCSDECRKEARKKQQKEWYQSEKGKASKKKYNQSEKGKERKKKSQQRKIVELIERYNGDLESILEKCPTHWMEREAIMQVEYGVSYYDSMRAKEKSTPVCEVTGVKNDLVIHHLYSFNTHPELGADPNNMVRINVDVHKEFHHIYGYGNNTREQWFEFVESMEV